MKVKGGVAVGRGVGLRLSLSGTVSAAGIGGGGTPKATPLNGGLFLPVREGNPGDSIHPPGGVRIITSEGVWGFPSSRMPFNRSIFFITP